MPKFKRKSTIIEAEQFYTNKIPLPFSNRSACCFNGESWYCITAHGQMTTIVDGDWIIPEPDNRGFYPVKPDIFIKNYEPLDREINLFQSGSFTLNSGKKSFFKIECDAATDADIETFAKMISGFMFFKSVEGIPTGGDRLAKALEKYIEPQAKWHIIVDDVLTTGKSMEKARAAGIAKHPIFGFVLFSRGKCPSWIIPLFQMPERLWL